MSTGFTQVQNNASHFIHLPPNNVMPNGFKLIPGSNNVPTDYVESLRDFKVPYTNEYGLRGTRPLFEDLALVTKASGRMSQVVVLGETAADAPTGPEAPYDLTAYSEQTAIMLVQVTDDRAALKRWCSDARMDVASAAKKKLGNK